mmetsp:Transcript_128021/g.221997  ORF Transcript_128021/g.221997 Transcript_128021/m.221997 type:complete len:212 (+) Transcript_128021:101-736(+)
MSSTFCANCCTLRFACTLSSGVSSSSPSLLVADLELVHPSLSGELSPSSWCLSSKASSVTVMGSSVPMSENRRFARVPTSEWRRDPRPLIECRLGPLPSLLGAPGRMAAKEARREDFPLPVTSAVSADEDLRLLFIDDLRLWPGFQPKETSDILLGTAGGSAEVLRAKDARLLMVWLPMTEEFLLEECDCKDLSTQLRHVGASFSESLLSS